MLRMLAFLFILLLPTIAQAKRIALVIGIGDYTYLTPLANPVNDATTIAEILRQNGFTVYFGRDLTREQFLDTLDAFKIETTDAEVALVYYAGHGLEIAGKNIVSPADMEFSCKPEPQTRRMIELDKVFDAIVGVPQQIVLLDACRNNPFPQCSQRGSYGAGFRNITVNPSSHRILIASSTLSGRLADDGPPGGHSPFAKVLMDLLVKDLKAPLRRVLDDVAREVALSSGGTQTPEVTTRGGAPDVCLAASGCGGGASPMGILLQQLPAPAAPSNCNADLDYQDALRKNTTDSYREFLRKCPEDKRKETVLNLYARLADEEMWRKIVEQNTLSGYLQYLDAFPSGTYAEAATQKRDALQPKSLSTPSFRLRPSFRPRSRLVSIRPPCSTVWLATAGRLAGRRTAEFPENYTLSSGARTRWHGRMVRVTFSSRPSRIATKLLSPPGP
jgi:hypothetical protein